MARNRAGQQPEWTYARQASSYSATFTASATAGTVSASLLQDEGIIASVARTGVGVYVLTLADRFARVVMTGAPNVQATSDIMATAVVVQGAQNANTITVRTFTANTGAAVDPADLKVDVGFRLITSAAGIR